MNDHGDYEAYRAEFGRRLDAADSQPPPGARRRWILAAAVATATAAAVALLVLDIGGQDTLDVVAEARAALPEEGELLYMRSLRTTSLIDPDPEVQERFERFARRHDEEYAPQRYEQWSTADRWRIAFDSQTISPSFPTAGPLRVDRAELERIGMTDEVTGPVQQSYDDRVVTLYIQELGASIVFHAPDLDLRDPGLDSGAAAPPPGGFFVGPPTLLGLDPAGYLRRALDAGELHDAGPGEVDGRAVRRLVDDGGMIEYDVDAETFAPVRVRMFIRWVAHRDDPTASAHRMAVDVTFEAFESMPLNDETEKLLEVDPVSPPTVIEAGKRGHPGG